MIISDMKMQQVKSSLYFHAVILFLHVWIEAHLLHRHTSIMEIYLTKINVTWS